MLPGKLTKPSQLKALAEYKGYRVYTPYLLYFAVDTVDALPDTWVSQSAALWKDLAFTMLK